MRALSLFTGYGGIDLALKEYITEVVAYVEIEEYAQKIIAYRMAEGSLRTAPILADVKNVKGDIGACDIIYGGFPCFVGGTLILTRGGYKPIEDIQIGEEVFTHLGRWRKVNQRHTSKNRTRTVKGFGILETRTTDEHPYYCIQRKRKWNNSRRVYEGEFSNPEWIEAKDIKKSHFSGQVLPEVKYFEGDENYWWIVGRYIADGWLVNRRGRGDGQTCRVIICSGKHKFSELEQRLSKCFHSTKVEDRTAFKYHISNKKFAEFLKPIGRGAHNKQIPPEWFSLPRNLAKALLDGYFSGDGSAQRNKTRATTVSPYLALGFSFLIQRVNGVCSELHEINVSPTKKIEGRIVNQRKQYQFGFSPRTKFSKNYCKGNYGWRPIKSSEPTGVIEAVYNIGVDEDESYSANGAIVHNCQDLSVAGNGKGLEGERSGLFYEVIRLTKEIRPSFVFLENVPAIRTRGLDQVIKEFTEMGYDCRWTMLSAESVGACHKRERWFLLAHNRCERGQGIGQEQIQGKRTLQRSKNVGRDQNFHRRPDLYEPKLCRSLHDVTFGMDRIKAIGNGVVPLQVKTAFEKLIGMGHTFL